MSRSATSAQQVLARGLIRALVAFASLALTAGMPICATAASLEISPVRVDLSSRARVAVLTVHNTGSDETVMQVSLLRWPVSEAMFALERSDDLLLTPTTFRLLPGAQQLVRVGLMRAPPPLSEAAYRLIIEEVPAMQEQDTTRMRLVVRHDLPVFVAPAAPVVHQLDMLIDCAPDGAGLHLRNRGNAHLKVVRMTLQDPATGELHGDWKTFEYLLPGGETWWLLSTVAPDAKGDHYTATAHTDQGNFPATVLRQCR